VLWNEMESGTQNKNPYRALEKFFSMVWACSRAQNSPYQRPSTVWGTLPTLSHLTLTVRLSRNFPFPFYKWENRNPESLSNHLSKLTQEALGWTRP
jgi:hypothetical protein